MVSLSSDLTPGKSFRGEERRGGGGKKPDFHLYVQYGKHTKMLKPKDPQQVFGIHQTARGMEPILARSSRCPCAGLKAMRRDRDRQKTKLENKLTVQYMCTGHATTLAMPPPSLTLSQHGKHKKRVRGR